MGAFAEWSSRGTVVVDIVVGGLEEGLSFFAVVGSLITDVVVFFEDES